MESSRLFSVRTANRSNRRPLAGRLLLATLLGLLLISGASAILYEDTQASSLNYTGRTPSTTNGNDILYISIYNVKDFKDIKSLYYRTTATWWSGIDQYASNPSYEDTVHYYVDGVEVGTGSAGYNALYTADTLTSVQCWFNFDDGLAVGTLIGTKKVYVVADSGPLFNGYYLPNIQYPNSPVTSSYPVLFATRDDGTETVFGYYLIRCEGTWAGEITYDNENLYLHRNIGGKPYYSTISFTSMGKTLSDGSYQDIHFPHDGSGTWTIQNTFGNWFNGSIGDIPPSVTIQIRSAETGSLIPNARVVILDTFDSTEAVNETLSTGTDTFTLERATTLRYHASATADNYTPLSPILFGITEATTNIVLWMSPDTAPDVPVEEGTSTLYGYTITQGSQQPISGATISLEGYGSTTTTSTGFYLFNNVTPGVYTISASAPLHDTLSEPVAVEAPATQHNLALTGHYLLAVTVKDGDTLANVQNATIALSDGQESTANPATLTADYGPYTISAAASGYYPATQSTYLDHPGTTTATVLLTAHPEPTPAPEYPNYPPHNVRFHCIDDYGGPLANVTVSAAYLETTTPWSWFSDLLGIPSSVSINETPLAGTTGTDGSIVFSLVETVQYAITAHDPASNLTVNFTLYPQETQYTIQFRTRPAASAETYPLYILEAVPLEGDTQVSLRLAYNDRDNATTSLSFWVKDDAGESVYTETPTLHLLGWTNTSHTVVNHPTSYTWGFDAQHATRGEISAARTITLHGSGRLVDLGFEDDFWYFLLSALWIIGIGALFSGSQVRFGAIIIPLIGGGIPVLIGWLPVSTAVLVGVLTFIGVFVYMRKSEYKLYR